MARQIDIIDFEQWKDVPSWPGYRVSNHGRLQGPRGPRRLFVSATGYMMVPRNDRGGSVLIHRLVAEAFLGPCPPGAHVHHKNNVRSDNHLRNLEYVSCLENNRAKYSHGTIPFGERNAMAKLTPEAVVEIRRRYDAGEIQRTIADDHGISRNQVANIGKRRQWAHI